MARTRTKPKPAKPKPGRRPERVEIYLRKEVRRELKKLCRTQGKRGKPLPRSTCIARLIMNASKDTETPPS